LEMPGDVEVRVVLSVDTAPWLLSLETVPARLALVQPSYERLTEAALRDVDLRAFFAAFRGGGEVPVDDVPACITGRPPRRAPRTLDAAMLVPDGRLEIFRFTKRYVLDHYRTKSLRCRGCVHESDCTGLHINFVRAHGYGVIEPVRGEAG
jgi:hypothetical protein